jgi:hypothetical protein
MANPLRGLLPGLFRNGGKGEGSTRPWCRWHLALLNEAAAVCGLALADIPPRPLQSYKPAESAGLLMRPAANTIHWLTQYTVGAPHQTLYCHSCPAPPPVTCCCCSMPHAYSHAAAR